MSAAFSYGLLDTVIAALQCYSGCWLLGNNQRKSFNTRTAFTQARFSLLGPQGHKHSLVTRGTLEFVCC